MHFQSLTITGMLTLAGVAMAQTATSGSVAAPTTHNNPDVAYQAAFGDSSKVQGSVGFKPGQDGTGVEVSITLSNFPGYGGPFLYHVHAHAVPSDGNCTGTLGHLDPYKAGLVANYTCDPNISDLCEVGDLSGKHGKIPADTGGNTFSSTYLDAFLSVNPGDPAFVGGLSVTVHLADKTRIACANITETVPDSGPATPTYGEPVATSTLNVTVPTAPDPYTGAASSVKPIFGYMAVALVAAAFL